MRSAFNAISLSPGTVDVNSSTAFNRYRSTDSCTYASSSSITCSISTPPKSLIILRLYNKVTINRDRTFISHIQTDSIYARKIEHRVTGNIDLAVITISRNRPHIKTNLGIGCRHTHIDIHITAKSTRTTCSNIHAFGIPFSTFDIDSGRAIYLYPASGIRINPCCIPACRHIDLSLAADLRQRSIAAGSTTVIVAVDTYSLTRCRNSIDDRIAADIDTAAVPAPQACCFAAFTFGISLQRSC